MAQNHNPYSPPGAPVADRAVSADAPRPVAVNIALLLLLAGAMISLLDALEFLQGPVPSMFGFLLIAFVWPLIKFGFALWICFQIARGRNWARWLPLAAVVFGVYSLWLNIQMVPTGIRYAVDPWKLTTYLLPTVLYFAAVILLFWPGRAWFRQRE